MKIKIGNILISNNSKPLIVAEIGINHFGSLKKAKKIVDSLKKIGIKAVKVQIHIPEEEMSSICKTIKPGNSNKNIYDIIKNNSLNLDEELELKKYIEKKNLLYIATPFSYKAAEWLNKNNIKLFKIGSGETNNIPFIKYVCSFKKPMIVSTGMNSLNTIKKTVTIIKKYNIPHVLLHCVNLYPTNYKLIRFNRMIRMKKMFKNSIIGYSDHTIGNTMPTVALTLGAKLIEKHYVISKKVKGPDTECSMDQTETKHLLESVDQVHNAFSSDKEILKEEDITRKFAFHSVVSKENISKGDKFSFKNLTTKRPGIGYFPASKIYYLLGKKSKRQIKKDTLLQKKDVI